MADPDSTPNPPRCRLLELSGELRNNIYGHLIDFYEDATSLNFSTPEGRQRKSLGKAFSLAKTCQQINREYGYASNLFISLPLAKLEASMTNSAGQRRWPHSLYAALKRRDQSLPEPPDYLQAITAIVKAIESLIEGHLAVHGAQCVTVALGVANKDDFPEHWQILQTPFRQLRKAVPEMRLSFDLDKVRGSHGHTSITLSDADVVRTEFEAVLSKLCPDDKPGYYKTVAKHILRTFFPLRYCQMLEAERWLAPRDNNVFRESNGDLVDMSRRQ